MNLITPATPRSGPEPFDLWWDCGYCGFEVVGEHYRRSDIQRILKGNGAQLHRSGELSMPMTISREPSNHVDPNAVAVLADGVIVGYVPREQAPAYHPPLDRLSSLGRLARVVGEIRWWASEYGDEPDYRVTLDLGAPSRIVPVNDEPANSRLLPHGRSLTVKEQPEALPLLSSLVRPGCGNEAAAWAILQSTTGPKGKELAVVLLNGTPVGTLTPASSTHFLPITRWAAERGVSVACRALLIGNELDVQVTIHAAKASELAPEWLAAEPPGTPEPSRQAPPLPPAGWHADPSQRHQLRYWDGAAWTEHVHDDGLSAADPL